MFGAPFSSRCRISSLVFRRKKHDRPVDRIHAQTAVIVEKRFALSGHVRNEPTAKTRRQLARFPFDFYAHRHVEHDALHRSNRYRLRKPRRGRAPNGYSNLNSTKFSPFASYRSSLPEPVRSEGDTGTHCMYAVYSARVRVFQRTTPNGGCFPRRHTGNLTAQTHVFVCACARRNLVLFEKQKTARSF